MLNRSLIAIDIGASAVKVVELVGKKYKKLKVLGLEIIPPSVIVDGSIQDLGLLKDILKDLLDRLNIVPIGRRAAISLGGSPVLIKRIQIDQKALPNLADQVFHEAEQHFQQDVSDLYFRYQELTLNPDHHGQVPVLLVGAKRVVVEQHINLVRELGMRVGVVDCDVLCLSNMFDFNFPNAAGIFAMINVGASVCQVVLYGYGQYLYTRDIFLGGDEYSKQITETMGIDFENAETLKVAASQGTEIVSEELQKIINHLNQQLVTEIHTSIDFFLQSGLLLPEQMQLKHVFLAGGSARLLNLDVMLSSALHVPAQVINPFFRINVHPKKFDLNYVMSQGHLYSVAMGLALRQLGDDMAAA